MSLSIFSRKSWLTVGSLSLISLGSLGVSNAQALVISNGSFEDNFNGWDTAGDVSIQGTFQGIDPTDRLFQALLTTATTVRDDDSVDDGAYNFSGTSAVDARSSCATDNSCSPELQSFLGLSDTALNFIGSPIPFPHDSKEGSAIKQSISSTTDFEISFDWSFLTNDGSPRFPGDPRDTAFVTLYNVTSDPASRTIQVLTQSQPVPGSITGFFPTPPDGTNFSQTSGGFTYNSGTLAAGDYILAIGVYDVDGTDKTSALLVDNVNIDAEPIPEPITILSSIAALGIGTSFKRKFSTKGQKG